MTQVNSNVEKLLQDNEKLRNSDIYLLFAYWQQHDGLKLTDEQKLSLHNLTTAESITRVRRALRDKYPGDKAIEEARFKKYLEVTDEWGYKHMKEV